ncbi:MAG: hypothetical protein U9R25_20240 [Chloroflexota bacterium]|nr:hypothetical protein [Chloroflexota bacterium]
MSVLSASNGRFNGGTATAVRSQAEVLEEIDVYLRTAAEALLKAQLLLPPYMSQPSRAGMGFHAGSSNNPEVTSDASPGRIAVPPIPSLVQQHTPEDDSAQFDDLSAGLPPVEAIQPKAGQGKMLRAAASEQQPPSEAIDDREVEYPMADQAASSPPGEPANTSNPASANNEAKGVGVPGVNDGGPYTAVGILTEPTDSGLSEELVVRQPEVMTEDDAKEVLSRISTRDLSRVDGEVSRLYDEVVTSLSSSPAEANVALEVLRKSRQILLKDPEQFAEAEFLVQKVRTKLSQVQRSRDFGAYFGPRLFAYEVLWLVFLAGLAIVTTVNGAAVARSFAYLLGVPIDSEALNWAIMFMSTVAWGGIGGVTSALWSLHHHISVAKDYDPVENMWYLSQPVMGMVLGGIVYLIVASGFLVVQVDLSSQGTAFGARLLPAAIAVVVGFRQTVVLTLVERVVQLLVPTDDGDSSTRPPI